MATKKIKLSETELSAFCRQLGMIVAAGLPIYQGLSILANEAENMESKEIYESLYDSLKDGNTLYATTKKAGLFPHYMLQMIKIGEETGRLDSVLEALGNYYEREADIRSGIKRAAFYPLIMSLVMIGVIIFLIIKVLPIFSQVYEELGAELTGVARTLLTISTHMSNYLLVIVIIFVLLFVLALVMYYTGWGRTLLQGKKLSLTIATSRFANCMYLTLSSGIDIQQGLESAKELVNNPFMIERIEKCQYYLNAKGEEHKDFEDALQASGVFSKIYSSWIAIGARTGNMEDVLLQISEAYSDETDERITEIISKIEPALVFILCFFVGLILISFLFPLFGIMQSIG